MAMRFNPLSGKFDFYNADPGVITNHNSLSGLTIGDPHTQYVPIDGSRTMTGALILAPDVIATSRGSIRYNTTDIALEYYDGTDWHDAGSPKYLTASDSTVAEGNNSLTGLKNKYLIKTIKLETTSTDWTLTIYSKDDYASDPIIILKNRGGDVLFNWDFPYTDKDSTSEFHYNFTTDSGSETHDIELWGYQLR